MVNRSGDKRARRGPSWGKGEDSLLCGPESQSRLRESRTRTAKNINEMAKKTILHPKLVA